MKHMANTQSLEDFVAQFPRSSAEAFLHVALPVGELVGIGASASAHTMSWRGVTCQVGASFAQTAADVASGGWTAADVMRRADEPQTWFDVVASGTRKVVWGTWQLFGFQVSGDMSCSDDDILSFAVAACLEGQRGSGVFLAGSTPLLIKASSTYAHAAAS